MKSKLTNKIHRILGFIADTGQAVEVRALAECLAIDRSTVGRIVADLCECGYLRKVDCHRVELGLGLIYLGQSTLNDRFFPQSAIQLLNKETDKLGVDSALATLYRNQLVYLNRSVRGWEEMCWWHYPLHGSNLALVILAEREGTEKAFMLLNTSLQASSLPDIKKESLRQSIQQRLDFFSLHGYAIENAPKYFNVSFPLTHENSILGLAFFAEHNSAGPRAESLVAKGSILRERLQTLLY